MKPENKNNKVKDTKNKKKLICSEEMLNGQVSLKLVLSEGEGVHPKRPHTKTATTKTATNEKGHRLKRPQNDTKTATFTWQMKSNFVIK